VIRCKILIDENIQETECSENIMASYIKMEKWNLLKLFHECGEGGIIENDRAGELNYDLL
jgi:hypothetical protein